ncbi:MAG: hypothetical protein CVV14_05060 [Gammaproteobacteria bacterium HGW-Gammaproteobacteria-4]|nr:MAG: hypothetical protein CVV14_05060 [Gammaproteobacteria bacterium HGW-Gammaproteobacteria-4]
MIHTAALRILLLALILTTLGCTSARTNAHTTGAPSAAAHIASPQAARSTYTVVLVRDHPVDIATEALTLELVAVKDDRCPENVSCIWAGHAAVTLKVGKVGAATRTITLGTQAPPHMRLPYDAAYEGYRFHLAKLEPGNTQSPATPYRATVTVGVGAAKQTPDSTEM